MCRAYGKGESAFVRLCYRKGIRKGERITIEAAKSLGWSPGLCVRIKTSRNISTDSWADHFKMRGYNARWDGKPLSSNPEHREKFKYFWQRGWQIADDEIRKARGEIASGAGRGGGDEGQKRKIK